MTKHPTAARRDDHGLEMSSKSEFAELTHAQATKLIRQWALAGATEVQLCRVTEWELDDLRRVLSGQSK
jgi:hypothetical protein